jgi:predicted ATPase/class 3 adenylate cyclase
MFCDLVGSTELSGRLDPEDLSKVIRGYQDACAGAIARFDGFLAKLMGDGVLAYFGFPHAHEDSAERAVRAALAILADVPRLAAPNEPQLRARIGIATGLVVVGDIVGTGVAREQSIVGETPNLAARLQALAEPDTLLVSQSTHRLIGRTFDMESAGEHPIKGFPQPVPMWRVRGESALTTRFAAARGASNGPLIGRQHEMGLLLDRWRLAASGEGQFILLAGEAGIGKSRLVDALREGRDDGSKTVIGFQCSSNYINTALYPMIRYLEVAAEFQSDDLPTQKIQKLETLLTRTGGGVDVSVPLFADLMSLPANGRWSPPGDFSPQQRKAATIGAFIKHVTRLAEQSPVLFLLEDAHWIDPTTIELMGQIIDAIEPARVLAIVTARPEFVSPWTGRAHATQLTLNRLSRAQCAQMVAGIAAAHAIPTATLDEIVAKTDGIPLFVEELTKAILESEAPDRAAVPATLQDSLMARLDRLGEAKEIAQIAAVIGRQFTRALLASVALLNESQLDNAVASLVQGEIVFPQRQATETSYSFKHALMRDAAYDSLLRTRRQALHARIGNALEERFPSIVEEEPELLAYHFEMAGLADAAARYHERAGDRAAAQSAYSEAVAHFSAALEQTKSLPDRATRELQLLFKINPALSILNGLQSQEVAANARRAYEIAQGLGDSPELFKATWNLWIGDNIGQRSEAALARAEELVALGNRLNDEDLLLEAIHCRWSTAWFHGDLAVAFKDSREGAARYDPARHHQHGMSFGGGHDTGVCAHGMQGMTLALSGDIDRARKSLESSIALAERLGHPHSLAHAYALALTAFVVAGDHAATDLASQHLIEIAEKYKFPPQHTTGLFFSGWARAVGPGLAAGLDQMEAEFPRAVARAVHANHLATMLAEVRFQAGRLEEAYQLIEQTFAKVNGPDIGFYLPRLLRLRDQCLARLSRNSSVGELDSSATVIGLTNHYHERLLALKAATALAASGLE